MIQSRKIQFAIFTIVFAMFYACTVKQNESAWSISIKGNNINIKAGILEQNLIISDTDFSSSVLSVSGDNMLKLSSPEIGFSLHKASPNQQPVGIDYSSKSGVDQSNAEANQTDALSVKKAKDGTTSIIQWVDSMYISGKNFADVFEFSEHNVFSPQEGNELFY